MEIPGGAAAQRDHGDLGLGPQGDFLGKNWVKSPQAPTEPPALPPQPRARAPPAAHIRLHAQVSPTHAVLTQPPTPTPTIRDPPHTLLPPASGSRQPAPSPAPRVPSPVPAVPGSAWPGDSSQSKHPGPAACPLPLSASPPGSPPFGQRRGVPMGSGSPAAPGTALAARLGHSGRRAERRAAGSSTAGLPPHGHAPSLRT